MSLALQYATGYLPPTWRILGRVMVPMTVRHVLLLEALESPLSPICSDDRNLGPASVALAVEVCSRTGEEAERFARSSPAIMKWRLRWRRLYFHGVRPWVPVAQFVDYRRFWFYARPEVAAEQRGTEASEVPNLLSLVGQLVVGGCSRSEILDTPCRTLLWDAMFYSDAARVVRVKEQTPERREVARRVEMAGRMTKEQMAEFQRDLLEARAAHIKADKERVKAEAERRAKRG